MSGKLLICTDLDRTLVPNGPQPESPGARERFAELVERPEVALAYVSGRHRALVEEAIEDYRLPVPDFVIGDVGTTLYQVGKALAWWRESGWEAEIGRDWSGRTHNQLSSRLSDLAELRLQEAAKQNDYKLSYYTPLDCNRDALEAAIHRRLDALDVHTRLIWSIDELLEVELLDILPARASKYHAVEALMKLQGFGYRDTVFCGDSGNDMEVLVSPVPSVLVANSSPEVAEQARRLTAAVGHQDQLYVAVGGFLGMNGNYAAGILEGIAHYHPDVFISTSS